MRDTMIEKKMEKAINEQINAELYSSYLYLSMATYFESISLGGFQTGCGSRPRKSFFMA